MNLALIPDSISILGALGWLVAAGVWMFNKYRKENDEHEKKLINTLQARVDILEKQVNESRESIEILQNENKALKDILLLRTPEDVEFREQVISMLKRIDDHYSLGGK